MVCKKGSITVFLIIILTGIMSLNCLLIELVRIDVAHKKQTLALENSMYSIMSKYDNDIKDYYNLYVYDVAKNNTDKLLDKYMYMNYASNNLSSNQYNARFEEASIEYENSIRDIVELERQILEYMRYRYPSQTILNHLEKMDVIKQTSKVTKVFSQKMTYERKAKSLALIGERLHTLFNGEEQNFILKLFGFDYFKKDIYIDKYPVEHFDNMIDEYYQMCKELKNMDDENIMELERMKNRITLKHKKILNRLIGYENAFEDVLVAIDRVDNGVRSFEASKEEYIEQLQINRDTYRYFNIKGSEHNIKIDFLKDNDIRDLYRSSTNNHRLIGQAVEVFNSSSDITSSEVRVIKDYLKDIEICKYKYKILKSDKSKKNLDMRKEVKKAFKELFLENNNIKSINDNIYDRLPSGKYRSIFVLDKPEFYKSSVLGYSEKMLNDYSKEFSIDYTMPFAKLLIDEYILTTFKHALSIRSKEVDSRYRLKGGRKSFFKESEIEYILVGDKSPDNNKRVVRYKILTIRFICNTIHLYSSSEKNKLCGEIAIAVAGIFTGGAGVPIVKTLILSAWSFSESLIDVKQLLTLDENRKLKGIPLIKSDDDWFTNIHRKKSKAGFIDLRKGVDMTKSKNGFTVNLNYIDYLRVLLYLQDRKVSLNRILDLISLNHKEIILSDLKTSMDIELIGSIKYLWMNEGYNKHYIKSESTFRY